MTTTTIDRRSLLRNSSTLGIIAATGAIGASAIAGIDTLAQSTTTPTIATATPDTPGLDRRKRLRERLKARRAARAARAATSITPTHADIPYVTDGTPQQVLDVYLPTTTDAAGTPVPATAGAAGASVPVVIWIHGGGWVGGDKRGGGVPYLLDDGYAIVSINYRLLQDAMFPAQIVDANAALTWVWHHAETYGFDRSRIVVAGGSAGGRSASLVAASANDGVEAFTPDSDVRIAALIDFFGGTDGKRAFEKNARRKALIESHLTQEQIDAMLQMIDVRTYVDAGDPPTLIVHGDQDTTVPIVESQELAVAMKAAGVNVTFETMPGRGHGMIHYQDAAVQEIVRTFLRDTLGPA
ncbi:MAG: alpha/beta hydrolase [Thermomicrobiales bacterium]